MNPEGGPNLVRAFVAPAVDLRAGRGARGREHLGVGSIELSGVDGAVVADVQLDTSAEPLPRALILRRADVDTGAVADAVVAELRGHRLSIPNDPDLAVELEARGAELVRASSLMVIGLPADVPAPEGVDLRPLRDAPEEYGEVVRKAYPPDHPDHELMDATPEGAAATVRGYLAGRIVGPLLADASAEARDPDGRVVGLVVVSEMPGDDEYEGSPWITDICVDPATQGRGIGRALLAHAINQLSAAGRPALGLAVTQGSPARRLYEQAGFVERFPAWTLNLT